MHAMFREDVPIALESGGLELRTCPIGGSMSVAFVTLPAGGRCDHLRQRPHWGYLLRGQLRLATNAAVEVYEAGQAFYLDPGAAPEALEDSEYLDFSPSHNQEDMS